MGNNLMRLLSIRLLIVFLLSLISSCSIIDNFSGETINKPIRETGVSASAKVMKIWETGVRINNNPVVGFLLLVTLKDGTSYEAKTKNVVSIVNIPQIQPGAILPVKVDPGNRQLVALDIYGDKK